MTSLPLFTLNLYNIIIKRKLHGGLKIWVLSFRDENNVVENEDKIHIFKPLCNILSVFVCGAYISFLVPDQKY